MVTGDAAALRVAWRREARRRARRVGVDVARRGASSTRARRPAGSPTACSSAARDPVVAVDVGHGQLAWSLRQDPGWWCSSGRTCATSRRCPAGPAELAVADLSFISLRTVAPALVRLTTPTAEFVLLVKPQFEAGRSRIGQRRHRPRPGGAPGGARRGGRRPRPTPGIVVTDVHAVAAARRRRQRRVPRARGAQGRAASTARRARRRRRRGDAAADVNPVRRRRARRAPGPRRGAPTSCAHTRRRGAASTASTRRDVGDGRATPVDGSFDAVAARSAATARCCAPSTSWTTPASRCSA